MPLEKNKDDSFLAEFGGEKVKRPLYTLPCVAERPRGKPSFQSDLVRALTIPHLFDKMSERQSGLKFDVGFVTVISYFAALVKFFRHQEREALANTITVDVMGAAKYYKVSWEEGNEDMYAVNPAGSVGCQELERKVQQAHATNHSMLQAVVVGSLLTNHPNLKGKLIKNATHTPIVSFWALFKALTAVVQFSLDSPFTSLFNTFSHPKKFYLYGGCFTLFA